MRKSPPDSGAELSSRSGRQPDLASPYSGAVSPVRSDCRPTLVEPLGRDIEQCRGFSIAQRHRAERLQQVLIELVAHFFHDREGLGVREWEAIGPLLDQREPATFTSPIARANRLTICWRF